MVNGLGKLEIYFKQGIEIKKILQKMIKIITKASKVSKRNMNKSLNIVKKFMKMLKIMLTDREKSI